MKIEDEPFPAHVGMDGQGAAPAPETRPPDNHPGETQSGNQETPNGIYCHAGALRQKAPVELAQPGQPMVESSLVGNGFATGFQPIVDVVAKDDRAAAGADHDGVKAQQYSRPEVKLEYDFPNPGALRSPQPLKPQAARRIFRRIGFAQILHRLSYIIRNMP